MPRARNEIRDIGGQRSAREIEEEIQRIFARQHDVIHGDQLRATGLGRDAIDYRLSTGRLHRVNRNVFTTRARLAREGRWLAAVLTAGDGAVLSHESGAGLWEMRLGNARLIDVTVPAKRRAQRGIRIHVTQLAPNEIRQRRGIPVTSPERTLLDLAATLNRKQLERAIRQAEYHQLVTAASLTSSLLQNEGRPGSKTLRAAMQAADLGTGPTRSDLEERFRRFLRAHDLPQPERNVSIEFEDGESIEVDCLWREQRLIAELDGGRAHRTGDAFHCDRRRDLRLTIAGWRPVRVTDRALRDGNQLAEQFAQLLRLAG